MRRSLVVCTVLLLVGLCYAGQRKPAAPEKPQVFTGKVATPAAMKGRAAAKPTTLELTADDGTAYTIPEDDASRLLFVDGRLRDRPLCVTAVKAAGKNRLQVIAVQVVKDEVVYDVDYWCEICQITANCPGACVCCGDPLEYRERPAK
jgi:hypothetical protein